MVFPAINKCAWFWHGNNVSRLTRIFLPMISREISTSDNHPELDDLKNAFFQGRSHGPVCRTQIGSRKILGWHCWKPSVRWVGFSPQEENCIPEVIIKIAGFPNVYSLHNILINTNNNDNYDKLIKIVNKTTVMMMMMMMMVVVVMMMIIMIMIGSALYSTYIILYPHIGGDIPHHISPWISTYFMEGFGWSPAVQI